MSFKIKALLLLAKVPEAVMPSRMRDWVNRTAEAEIAKVKHDIIKKRWQSVALREQLEQLRSR